MSQATMPSKIAKIPKVVIKKRFESFETYNKANSMGGNTKHDPRSGCRKINTIGRKNTATTFAMVLTELRKLVILERARMAEAKMRVPILARSDGCMRKALQSIHLWQPYTFTPRGDHMSSNVSMHIP